MSLEDISEENCLYTDAVRDKNDHLLNDVANLRHNAFATSARSDKTAFTVHFFDTLHALKSTDDA